MTSLALIFAVGLQSIAGFAAPQQAPSDAATNLVQSLKQFKPAIPGTVPGNGILEPIESLRRQTYDLLWTLGSAAIPALTRGLADPDVRVRQNVALFLNVAGGSWYDSERKPRLDIRPNLSALVKALSDADSRVRGLAAQALGVIGPSAAVAVPTLIRLLASAEEGDRISACIALGQIGAAAREALPDLRKALSDASDDVRRFAGQAIEKIER